MLRIALRALPVILLSLVLTTVGVGTVGGVDAGAAVQPWTLSPSDEADYIAKINAIRQARGLGTLTMDANMTAAARDWTVWMAENQTLAHADDIVTGAPADWLKVGENVGRGGSLDAVWQAFLDSPSHAENVLDPVYNLVGVGVVWTEEGRLYTTHRFASTASGAPGQAPDPTPVPQPTPEPEPAPTAEPTPAPTTLRDPVPEQLAFAEPTPVPPPADPDRLAATMTLLLDAG